ncbi:lysine 2,3-aminomutase [Candidatus Sumerlaeota bacterium]|nr:lysine 2,3-aminomutase [Candidatus Sumerlaeota bacterium]
MPTMSGRQREVAKLIGAGEGLGKWRDWRWQVRHCIRDIATFERLLGVTLSDEDRGRLEEVIEKFPISVTPYYLSLISTDDLKNDPIFQQAIPSPSELMLHRCDLRDPLAEDRDCPVPGITHRYPDRVLFLVSNVCAMYCRHCTRKRRVGDVDHIPDRETLKLGIDYIRETPQVRDVLLSGGDPLMLSDDLLDWLLTELRAIEHVEVIRIGTRMPVVLPQRITDDLVAMLRRHNPLWVNTQFNHPREITSSSRQALRRMADAGLPLGNQTVLLAGVNDCPRIIRKLVHELVKSRVRPYYLYQCDLTEGLAHFRTPVGKGIEIIESLLGHTSGFAVPRYVIDAPGGGGKIPIMPNYLISWSTHRVVLRNYQGVITTYREPDSYEPVFCDRNCEECNLQLRLEGAEEYRAIGIEKLLADYDETTSLTPEGMERPFEGEERSGP